MATTYEFVVETLDFYEGCGGDPDIIDCNAWDTLEQALAFAKQCEEPWRIALRRDVGNDVDGLTDRSYAYPDTTGKLPEYFTYGADEEGPKVPKRFAALRFPTQHERS